MGKLLCALLLFTFVTRIAAAQSKPEEVVFSSGGRHLHGFLWKPEGSGPFPAILWNHGSEKLPGSQPALAAFYTAHSYVFFVPHRRGQGRSPGDYIQEMVRQAPPGDRARRMVELQEDEVDDVVAGLSYLKSQAFVDPARIAISGCSYGGI
jgi:carboxymethylenebutenolidase